MHFIVAGLVALLAFTASASAAELVIDGDLGELVQPVLQAAQAGNWPWALAAALVLATAVMRRFGAKRWPFWASGQGAAILLLVGSFAASLATAFAAGAGLSWHLMKAALGVAITAAGGYSLIKTFLPALQRFMPAWLGDFLGKVFPDKSEQARMAGEKAVKDNPPGGAAGVIGEPRDLP